MAFLRSTVAFGVFVATGVSAQQGGQPQQMQYPNFFNGELKDLWGELEQTKDLVSDYHCQKQTEFMKEINQISEFFIL